MIQIVRKLGRLGNSIDQMHLERPRSHILLNDDILRHTERVACQDDENKVKVFTSCSLTIVLANAVKRGWGMKTEQQQKDSVIIHWVLGNLLRNGY